MFLKTTMITIIVMKMIIIITIKIIMIINYNKFPETRKYCVEVQRGTVSFHGERDPLDYPSLLALVGYPARDGDSIKILVWRHLKPNSQLLSVNYV